MFRFWFATIPFILLLSVLLPLGVLGQGDLVAQGRYELTKGRYAEAIELFNRSLKKTPENPNTLFLRGIAKYELQDLIGAQNDFSASLAINDRNAEAWLFRGVCRSRQMDYKNAFSDFAMAEELNPKDQRIYENRALAYLQLDRYVDAISDCNRIIELNKADSRTYLLRGEAKSGLGMYRVAIDDMEHAMELDSLDPYPLLYRGIAHMKAEEFDKALRDMKNAFEMDTADLLPVYHQALCHIEMGEERKARSELERVLDRFPDNSAALYHRAIILIGQQRWSEAMQDLSRITRINPKNTLAYFQLAWVKQQTKNYEAALRDLNEALRIFPEFLDALEMKALIHRELGDAEAFAETQERIADVKRWLTESDEALKLKQHVSLMKATGMKSTFRPLQNDGLLKYEKVDVRLQPFFLLTPFPEMTQPLHVYDGYGKPHYSEALLTLVKADSSTLRSIARRARSLSLGKMTENDARAVLVHAHAGEFVEAQGMLGEKRKTDTDVLRSFTRITLGVLKFEELKADHFERMGQLTDVTDTVYEQQKRLLLSGLENDLRRVLQLDPAMRFASYDLGLVLAEQERYEEALDAFGNAILLDGKMTEAIYNRGLIHILLNNDDAGCADMSRAGELGAENAYAVINRYCDR